MKSETYELQGKDQFSFVYSENNKFVIIGWEMLVRPHGMLIYINAIRQWTEPSGELIDDSKRKEIQMNCKEGWNFLGTNVEFE